MEKAKSRRGFASMDPEKQKAIASKGGKRSHELGRAHKFTPEEARIAGKVGGDRISKDREHMARIGQKGGSSRWVTKNNKEQNGIEEESSEEGRSEEESSSEEVSESSLGEE